MTQAAIIGIDLAKNIFHAHGATHDGTPIFRKTLSRNQVLPFLSEQPQGRVAMEACATAHDWAREIGKLGHTTKLIPPQYVKPYVKRQKNDSADAEAITEAVSRRNTLCRGQDRGPAGQRHGQPHPSDVHRSAHPNPRIALTA
mgnify:CR=1 FL=1